MNLVIVSGVICEPPRFANTSSNIAYTTINLKVENGKYSSYVSVSGFGEMSATMSKLQVGQFVTVQGRISTNSYIDEFGATKYITSVTANLIELGNKNIQEPTNRKEYW